MSTETTVTETAEVVQPEASEETKALNAEIDAEPGANTDDEASAEKSEETPKKERTPEERERMRMQRRIDRLTAQRAELRAKLQLQDDGRLTDRPIERDNHNEQRDNETLSLSRKELQELISKEARQLAPQIKQQESEIEHRRAVVTELAKAWGQEKFDAYAAELDDAFGGLADQSGKPKPATDAIFESEDPRSLIEFLADPDNADEAEAIGRMSAVQAGRAIAKLEAKLAQKKAEDKPQPSKATPPIEDIRGQGAPKKSLFDLSDREFMKRRREQVANRR